MTGMKFRSVGVAAMALAVTVMAATPADARRGGSFGSRGARTAVAPPSTMTAPKPVAPVQRSMADKQGANQAAVNGSRTAPGAASKSGGLAKGLIGGLIAGGLIGMLLGNGFGALSGSGILMAVLQAAMLAGLIWLALRLFRRRSTPAMAPAGGPAAMPFTGNPFAGAPQGGNGGYNPSQPLYGSQSMSGTMSGSLSISMADKEAFERLLNEVQDAFAREDYAGLRARTTPEVMSYLAEELSQNATRGLRNDVSNTELLEAEVAEAWSEGDADYATIAMRFQSIDVMRDRTTGEVVEGDPTQLTPATELWTFVREPRTNWRLSAIQEA